MHSGVPIVLYHRVGPRDGSAMDAYTVSPSRFEEQMAQIAATGRQGVALEDLLDAKVLPDRAAVITFDDGFASNREHAWPVLERYGFRATTFVVAGLLGGVNSWDQADMPRHRLLERSDLCGARASCITFQSHGATHANLNAATEKGYVREIYASRTALADILGRPVDLFAYPFGAWNRRVRDAVASAGYRAACTCEGGRNAPDQDPFLLRRVEIRDEDIGWRLAMKLRTGWHLEKLAQPRSWRGALASSLR